ncbi:MAG: hypothetical protein GX657_03070 [Chloroflexi bacterium]|nr:hypothetical protein [Chloroflexota bacterium]
MQLRAYWRILVKYWWIVLGLPALVALSYPFLRTPAPTQYSASMRFVVGVRPEQPPVDEYTYDRYYTWLTAEYLIDDLAEVVKSRRFAEDVSAVAGFPVPPGAIQGATSAGKLHRILSVSVGWSDPAQLERIAEGVEQVLVEGADAYFAQLSTGSAVISLIDPPVVHAVGRSLRDRLDLPLRLLLALAAGVALAFLLDYLDDSVRGPADLAALGLPVLAEVPARRSLLPRLGRPRTP